MSTLHTEMMIDEWNGWVWTCFHCDHIDREATHEETEEFEKKMYKQVKNDKINL